MDVIASPIRPDAASHEPIAAARAWLDATGQVALATVVGTWGSSPVPVGGQLAVAPDGRFEGSVSGGCVEAEVIGEAERVIATGIPKLLEYGVEDETAWRAGLPCGGRIQIFLEALDAARDAAYLDTILAARAKRAPLIVRQRLTDGGRELFSGGLAAPPEVAAALASGASQLIDSPEGRFFLHALVPPVRLIVVGATHIGQALSDFARRLGYNVSIVDPRSAFVTRERFADAARYSEWPEPALGALDLDARTAVVALTHAAHIDDEALATALRSPCFYIGALGSKRNHAKRVERLLAMGIPDREIARIRAPVGLAIGAKGPHEIAIAILAQIIKDARGA